MWNPTSGICRFSIWAPWVERVELHLVAPSDRVVPMARDAEGVFRAEVEGPGPGTLYRFRIDDGQLEIPDPASRLQPDGVHGPSAVVDPRFDWSAAALAYRPPPLADWVIYELHVGAFSDEGTFDGVVPHLNDLRDLGVTAVELMPFAQFPGEHNWGYDGALPYAVQASYGGPAGLRRLVNACHDRGLAVIADVVYNHLGPVGNHLGKLGPYFTDAHHTPWGQALNFDSADSEPVRRFFIDAARMLVTDYHIDSLRVDAIHAITDTSARPFLQQLCVEVRDTARRAGRDAVLIAESDLNDARALRPPDVDGLAFDAQWADDFHHAVHAAVTGEQIAYYADFGGLDQVARAMSEPFLYQGAYSRYRRRAHGNAPHGMGGERFVVCLQNHDQIGNRATGDRPITNLPFELQKTLACMLLLSPYIPLLFMGQEYGETAPFAFFTDFSDVDIGQAVRDGRRRELAAVGWDPADMPDPQAAETFERSRLDWTRADQVRARALWELHRELIAVRRSSPALAGLDRHRTEAMAYPGDRVILLRRGGRALDVVAAFSLSAEAVDLEIPLAPGTWHKLVDTGAARWHGEGDAAPVEVTSRGAVSVTLGPHASVAFEGPR